MIEEKKNDSVVNGVTSTTKIKTKMEENLKPKEEIEIIEKYKKDAIRFSDIFRGCYFQQAIYNDSHLSMNEETYGI